MVIAFLFSLEYTAHAQQVTSHAVGQKVFNRWNWNNSNHWAGFDKNCESIGTNEIIMSVEDPSHYQMQSDLIKMGNSKDKGTYFGKVTHPLSLEDDHLLVKVSELKKKSSCLKVGSLLVIPSEDVQKIP